MAGMEDERIEVKNIGQDGMKKCLGSVQGPNWVTEPLVGVGAGVGVVT